MGRGRLIASAALLAALTAAQAAEPKGPLPPWMGESLAQRGAESLAYGAGLLPRLGPLPSLRGTERPPLLPPAPPGLFGDDGHDAPGTAEPEMCLVAGRRCSAAPCMQYVRRGLPGCDPYPDSAPRIIPVRP